MECKNCGAPLPENAKFCPECGQRVEVVEEIKEETVVEPQETEVVEETDVEVTEEVVEPVQEQAEEAETESEEEIVEETIEENEPEEDEESDQQEETEDAIWYYVSQNQAVGPFTETQMVEKLSNNEINENTLVWKQGMEDWVKLNTTELCQTQEAPKVEPEEQWYYIDGKNAQNGPFTLAQMKALIQARQIFGNTFVWKTGMADWMRLKNTELASLATPESPNSNNTGNHTQQTYSSSNANTSSHSQIFIMERSIGLSIVLAIVTCGIYSWYWLYCLARDINVCCTAQNKPRVAEPGIVLLLSIVTCGLYGIYFYWKAGKTLSQLSFDNGFQVPDNSIIMLVMPILGLGIISMAICQSTLNDIARYANR